MYFKSDSDNYLNDHIGKPAETNANTSYFTWYSPSPYRCKNSHFMFLENWELSGLQQCQLIYYQIMKDVSCRPQWEQLSNDAVFQ